MEREDEHRDVEGKRTGGKLPVRVVVKPVYVGGQPMEELIRTVVVDSYRRRRKDE